jgi:RNA polymerase sigma-70 factor (ECF subfamily)
MLAAAESWAMTAGTVPRQGEGVEAALVKASQGGDRGSFGQLVVLHQHRVFRLASRFFRHPEDIEEAAQETFLRAWQKLGSYRAEAPFEHWLTRLCLNCCYELLRRRPPRAEPLDAQLAAASTSPTARLEVERLLAQLKATDKFLLQLLYGEGWSVAQVAAQLGWTSVNVKVRAHRARRRLRKVLRGESEKS